MRVAFEGYDVDRIADYGEADAAREGIDRFETFLRSLGCPTRLSHLGLDGSLAERYARETMAVSGDGQGHLFSRPMMTERDVLGVLRAAA